MHIPRRWLLVPLILYWVGIFVATHLPAVRLPHTHINDKVEHFGAYFILAMLLANEISLKFRGGRGDWIVLLIIAIYGAGDEWTQQYVGRQTDLVDWYADMAGAACGIMVWGAARMLVQRFRSPPRISDINELAISGCNVDQKFEPASNHR